MLPDFLTVRVIHESRVAEAQARARDNKPRPVRKPRNLIRAILHTVLG